MKWLTLFLLVFIACQRMEVKRQKIDDVELAYYTKGSGEPLVLVMGFRGTMSLWDPAFINELAKHYQLIVFDNRGVGLSTDTQEDHTTIEQMAKDTIQLIKALGFEKVHLLGWSMGSMIAMQIGIEHPEALKTLILCSPNPGGTHAAKRTTNSYERLTSTELSKQEALSLLYPDNAQGKKAAEDFVLRLTNAIEHRQVPHDLTISQQTVERQVHALTLRNKDDSIYEKLPTIQVPTLVAGGLMDILDVPENTQTVAHRIPYAWSAYFPNAGHAFASQDHAELSRLIRIFIESTKPQI